MKRFAIGITVLALFLACNIYAWAMASEYGPHQPIVQQPAWPVGLADVLKSQKPVYAYWVNFADYFFYSGDANAFNAFIERYLKVEDITYFVILHPGQGKQKRLMEDTYVPFDWKVSVVPIMIPDGGMDKNNLHKRYVTIDLYVGGNVRFDKAKLPEGLLLKLGKDARTGSMEDRLEFGKAIPLLLKGGVGNESNVVSLYGVTFKREGDMVQADIRADMLTWPKSKWKLIVELLDKDGSQIVSSAAVLENAGIIISRPATQSADQHFTLGPNPKIPSAQRFRVKLEQIPEEQ